MKLYIIGNGFDLNHGMETSYLAFKNFLVENKVNVHEFENYDYFPNPIDEKWSNVENHLEIDYDGLFDFAVNAYYPDLNDESDSRWHNLEIELEIQTELLNKITNELFYKWIISLDDYPDSKFALPPEALYVTFNYTHVLENTYHINPLHIHGDKICRIQFGCFYNDPTLITSELKEQYGDYDWYGVSIEPAINELKRFCQSSFKDYLANKQILEDYLKNKEIDEIIVMGHSFLGIDERYYEDVFSKYRCKWTIYCHSPNDYKNAIEFEKKYGLKVDKENW